MTENEAGFAADAENAPEAQENRREKSTIAFPYMDLTAATEVAQGIFDRNGGGTVQSDELAAQLKLKATSSGFRTRIATAKLFGFIESERGVDAINLTDAGLHVVSRDHVRKAKADAFLRIPLFKEVYEAYKGTNLPPAAALQRRMQEMGVAPKQSERARQILERSAEDAGYFESGRDRLVRPANMDSGGHVDSGSGSTPPLPPPSPNDNDNKGGNGGSSGNGGGSGTVHPAIEGILQLLPRDGEKWPVRQRAKWLSSMNNVLELVYDSAEEADIEVIVRTQGSAHG
ncbi:MAG: hypothetical protein JJ938_15695 [Roseicyclus sp.]|nr:hypothetical protein [Roseicyclus sp.]MBO6626321.1 hypothetical protein [Roseicyclus sp.]MBO6924248.1 hypothetical protein [Roseicyclus sp.]